MAVKLESKRVTSGEKAQINTNERKLTEMHKKVQNTMTKIT